MPVYNGEKYLKESIESILNQTEKDFEFIIVDDGSVDKTSEIIKTFSDSRIRYEKRIHRGLIESLNHGIIIAKGEYIARMDADDKAISIRLEKQLSSFLENKDLAMCGSWAIAINEKSERKGEISYPKISSLEIKKYIIFHNPFIHPTVMIRKRVLNEAGYYRNFWKNIEDYELWTRIVFRYKILNIPEYLLEYRLHSNQVTVQKKWEMRIRGVLLRILALWRFLRALPMPQE